MFNTFGIRSVNGSTFNQVPHGKTTFPREARNIIITVLRVHNTVSNMLGYLRCIPGLSIVTGSL